MLATFTLFRREFSAYFLSPVAYVVLGVFLALTGYLFTQTLDQLTAHGPTGVEYPFQLMLGSVWFWFAFLFIPPLLTMRLFAEERSTGTLEVLLTAPLRDWQVVLSKYIACFAFYVVMWLPTLLYLPVLLNWNWQTMRPGVDPWPVASSYLGLALVGAMFIALGLFVSSLVRSQMVAALIAVALSLGFFAVGLGRYAVEAGGIWDRVLTFFHVPVHFTRDFSRGIVDTRHLVLYGSVTVFCLFLTARSLEARRWR